MVDSQEFVFMQQNADSEKDFKLATVTELFTSGTAKIKFFGEVIAAEKEYSYLASYKTPAVDDIVLVVPFLDTYIIAGNILFQAVIPEGTEITMDDVITAITNALSDYVKTEDLSEYAKSTDLTSYYKMYSNIISNNMKINGELNHEGSLLSFFNGSSLRQKQSVSTVSTSATLATVISKLNELITALNAYNLV